MPDRSNLKAYFGSWFPRVPSMALGHRCLLGQNITAKESYLLDGSQEAGSETGRAQR